MSDPDSQSPDIDPATRILVVDDDPAIRQIVRYGLEGNGCTVSEAHDGATAVAYTTRFDVVVLDLGLPDMSGLDVLAQLRNQDPDVHVIVLTGAHSEADRVRGLVSGADDYMVKPFSVRELAARVSAIQRRRSALPPRIVEAAGVRVDTLTREAWVGSRPLDLTRREFDLLEHLITNPGRTFSREELLAAVWDSSAEWQSAATITEHVRRLRRKTELDPEQPVRIVTVRGSGYRFDPDRGEDDQEPAYEQPPPWHGDAIEDATVVLVGAQIKYASPAALELVGATDLSEAVGHDVDHFIAPNSLGAVASRRETLEQGRSPRPETMTLVRLDGKVVLVEVASRPVMWNGEHAIQVTVWELNTAKLQELAIGVRTDVTDAVVVTDSKLRIQSLNAAAENLYGWKEHEAIGRPSLEVLPWAADDVWADSVREAFQRDGRWNGEVVQVRRDGTPITVRASVTLLRDNTGQPLGTVAVSRTFEGNAAAETSARAAATAHESEIRRGLDRGEFAVHYQPVVRLDTTRWDGVEALVRWQHPERGLLAPSAFMDAAEASGAIADIDRFVLEEACQQWATWRDHGHDLNVAVNLSGRQLAEGDLAETVGRAMNDVSMPAGRLWLEITETALVHNLDEATAVLQLLEGLGARLAIDDFGTGWASLSYLRQFPVHALKVDRVFVQGLGHSSTDAAIVSSILRLADELELTVIAEGIETAAQLAHLLQLGCVLGQGYLFGRPAPADALGLNDS